jgi:hypothetical protein
MEVDKDISPVDRDAPMEENHPPPVNEVEGEGPPGPPLQTEMPPPEVLDIAPSSRI